MESSVLAWLSATLFAYLIGSVPTGIIIGKVMGVDVRSQGSGSAGATNVARTVGPQAGILSLVLDLSKGAGVVFLTVSFAEQPLPYFGDGPISLHVPLAGVFAVIGHTWPVWTKFKGGRGVATGLGALFVISPWGGLAALIGVSVAVITRYISAGSLIGTWTSTLTIVGLVASAYYGLEYLAFAVPVTVILSWRHRENIRRLVKGEEKPLFSEDEKGKSHKETDNLEDCTP